MTGSVPRELVALRQRLARMEKGQRYAHGGSIENSALEVRDDTGSLRAIVGQQGDGTTAVNIVNGPPPPQPTAPSVASVLGGITVSWDGTFANGAVIPLDWSRVEVHASIVAGFTPTAATLATTIETAQGATVVVSCDTDVYVRLVARNTSGTASIPSTQVGPNGPTPVVADDIQDGIVTTLKLADDAVTAAKVAVGAIGTDQLALGIGNLAPDPSFEGAYTAQLIAARPDWTLVTPGNNSATALHVDCTSGFTTWKNIELARYPVLPGERHYLAVDFRTSAAFDGTGVKLMFRYEDAAATVLGYGVADKAFTPGAGWYRATAQVQAPAGTATAVLLVEASACSAGEAWFDNAEVSTLVVGGKVAAGSITANEIAALTIQAGNLAADSVAAGKVAADAITGREIQALSVTSDELAANSVIAGKIAAGAVTANSLTVGVAQSIATKITDAMGDSTLWAQTFDPGTTSWLTGVTDAAAGGTVAQAAGPVTLERTTNTPYDPDTLYKVTVRVRTTAAPTAGTPTVYMGLVGVAADGTTRVNSTGANNFVTGQHFITANNVTVAAGATWTTLTGYVQGNAATGTTTACPDPKAPGKLHTNARYVRPIVRLLMGATGGTMQVDQVTVETVPTGVVNSVNIANGAVTATSLAADAITGKTITGGVLQTAVSGQRVTINEAGANKILVYDSTSRPVAELSGAGMALQGTNGSQLIMDPNNTFPNFRLTNAARTNEAVINVSENTAGAADLGLNSGKFSSHGWTDMKWRTFFGNDFWVAEKIRDSATATHIGGRVYLGDTTASIGYENTADTTSNARLILTPGFAQLTQARMQVDTPASSSTAFIVNAATGQAGHLLRLLVNTVDKFRVDQDGNTTVEGLLTARNIVTGSVTITPVANTPTSVNVTGLNLPGTVHRAFLTAQSQVPGTVVECSATNVTSTGLTVWVNRTNNTSTNIWYLVIAS
ncbi:hypothetical protein [Streptomyces bluensis]|uniref:Fibronectin type-III domain-containing protein n=1 Tax=Streptomyces bluensis TaxID=33897 RepID=A0ABW6UUH0_9ACTN